MPFQAYPNSGQPNPISGQSVPIQVHSISGLTNSGPSQFRFFPNQVLNGQFRPFLAQASLNSGCLFQANPNLGLKGPTQAGADSGPSQFRPSCPNSGRCQVRPIPIQAFRGQFRPVPTQAGANSGRCQLRPVPTQAGANSGQCHFRPAKWYFY